MKKVYFISGLGADKRAFSFLDLSFCEPHFIDWIKPGKSESLQSYALRLKEQITTADATIVGVSFGGMLATEIAKADPSVKAILISSNKVKKEFPRTLRIGKYLPLYKFIPAVVLRKGLIMRKLFLGPDEKKQKAVYKAILNDTDFGFTKWAVGAILHWENQEVPANVVHIHGTADRLLPYSLVKADYSIEKGSHLMIMNNHEELTALLKTLI